LSHISRKGLFWLTVLEVSVHEQLTGCFLACGEASIMAGEHGGTGNSSHGGQEAKIERKRDCIP
jgi:hypothetical protein